MNRLRELRQEKSLTLKEVSNELSIQNIKLSADGLGKYEQGARAPKIRIPTSTLSDYERGDSEPKSATWELLADYFDVDPEYLVGWSDVRRRRDE